MSADSEDYRITNYTHGETPPPVVVTMQAVCSDLPACLDRVKEVMVVIARYRPDAWPSDEEWERLLPAWFVTKTKAHTIEEIERDERCWDWEGWLDAMKVRGWEWWSSTCSQTGWACYLVAHSWPYGSGPLEYVAYSAGASSVTVADEANTIFQQQVTEENGHDARTH
jgi:hypothetical protein